MTYADKVKREQAEAQEWLEVHGHKLEAEVRIDLEHNHHETVDVDVSELFEEDQPYCGLNGGSVAANVGWKAQHGVTLLAHWQGDIPRDDSGYPTVLRPAGGKLARWKPCSFDAKKYAAHCKAAAKKQRYHGLEFVMSPRGTAYSSTRPSTVAKVKIAYREQVKSENPDLSHAQKVAPKADMVKACMIAMARGGIHRVRDKQGDESAALQVALKTGLPRKLNSIRDKQVDRAPLVIGEKHKPVTQYLTARDKAVIANTPVATYRARLSVAFRKAGISL